MTLDKDYDDMKAFLQGLVSTHPDKARALAAADGWQQSAQDIMREQQKNILQLLDRQSVAKIAKGELDFTALLQKALDDYSR